MADWIRFTQTDVGLAENVLLHAALFPAMNTLSKIRGMQNSVHLLQMAVLSFVLLEFFQ
jgi:hypothetical protein